MGTDKRDRQKAARRARLEQARAAEARARRNKTMRNAALFVALVVVIALVIARPWQSDDDEQDVAADATTTTTGETSETGEFVYGTGACPEEDGSSPQMLTFDAAPQLCIDPEASYTAEVETTEGTVTIELDAQAAPGTVNNFVTLARYHFYDDVAFHRIIEGFVNQTGDPTGEPPGTGNPGYEITDELPTDTPAYVAGSVAMANSGPNTSGGQFFVVVGDGGDQLQPLYSRFGQVTEGQDVMDAINADFGEAPGGAGTPSGDVRIVSVTITEESAADGDDTTTTTSGEDDETTTTTSGDDETTTTTDDDETTTTTAPVETTVTT